MRVAASHSANPRRGRLAASGNTDIQDYVNIYALKIWQEELTRIILFNVERVRAGPRAPTTRHDSHAALSAHRFTALYFRRRNL